MHKELIFVTSNPHKAEQISRYLNLPVKHVALELPEVQSLDLEVIVTQKVKAAFEIVQAPVLVEDVSLVFTPLGKLPGPFIKWFLGELGREGLCRLLDGYPSRTAVATVLFAYYDGDNLELFEGQKKGTIADHPRGTEDFGWNPVFIPDGYEQTWGEMNLEQQRETSMRRVALEKLEMYSQANIIQ